MERREIPVDEFNLNIFKSWSKNWFLLTVGENKPGKFNTMTVGWGSLGVMWNKPFAQVVVRPSRYTFELIQASDTFTLSAFSEKYENTLTFCGSHSGRDLDKVKEAKLTPKASQTVAAPGFDEAELIIECRKIYTSFFDSKDFLSEEIEPCYNGSDYHHVYFGEILKIKGTDKYLAK
ncbi:MAG: flavin reductase [Planctomycetes bacterium]|nr:flavin reductase [Planctomycetota bacterium]